LFKLAHKALLQNAQNALFTTWFATGHWPQQDRNLGLHYKMFMDLVYLSIAASIIVTLQAPG